jgi:tetratricopeptide (TPR) repeat protein
MESDVMIDADALKEEGLKQFQRGEVDKAVATFETAVSAYTAAQNPTGQAEMLNNIGVIQRMQGNHEESLQAFTTAETLCQQTDDVNRRAQVLGNMGDLYAAMGDKETAARHYSDAAELFAQCGDAKKQSQVLKALSLLRLRQGQWMMAMMYMEASLRTKPRRGLFGSLFLGMLRFATSLFGKNVTF